jgi:PAS domain S-box-containing protein
VRKGDANAMTLRTKTLCIIGTMLGCLIAALYFSSRAILLQSFGTLEDRCTADNVQRALNAFSNDLFNMDRFLRDWAAWDDTCKFVEAPKDNKHFAESNLVDTVFTDQRLDIMLFFNAAGQPVYAKSFDRNRTKEVPIPESLKARVSPDSLLLRHPSVKSAHRGVLLLPDAVMLIVSQPILSSANEGPIRGTLIFGRYLDEAERKRLADTVNLDLYICRVGASNMCADCRAMWPSLLKSGRILTKPLDDKSISGYALVNDIYGKPALIFRTVTPRDIFHQGLASIRYLLVSLLIVGFAIGATIVILLQRQVLSPLTRLGGDLSDIGARGAPSGRVPVSGRDELADLALAINGMLSALEKTQDALRESEHKYSMLLRNIPQRIFYKDENSVYMLCNKSYADDLGITPDEIVGKTDYDFYPKELAEKYQADDEQIIRAGIAKIIEEEYPNDGRMCTVQILRAPVRDSAGAIVGVFGIFWDITERKRMEVELIKSQKLESLGVLAGGIAHDFNNILTAVLGYLSLAGSIATLDGEALDLIRGAEKAAMRAKDLTHQLLTFSMGGTPVKKVFSLSTLLRDVADFAASGSSVKCEFSIPKDLWSVNADEGQISQVVNNLVINAVQAMPEGGTIQITAENVPAGKREAPGLGDKDHISIRIRDHGIGIPSGYLQKIFDPYFTTKQRGSGLGLATCYSIIKNHGGMITVQSESGKGSTFCVYLPAAAQAPTPAETTGGKIINGMGRVLLMDDEETVRDVGEKMLRYLGYEVACVPDGASMLTAYREARQKGSPFDVVIMDLIVSGGMGGKEAIKHLLDIDPGARAIVSSGYANDPIMADYSAHGFSGVVAKPYRIEELGVELRRVLAMV